MKIKLNEVLNETWWQFTAEQSAATSNYKLHVAIPIGFLDSYFDEMQAILKKGIEEGVIFGFKILNRGNSDFLTEQLKREGGDTFATNPNIRLYNNPITIYLYEDLDAVHVRRLCQQMEEKLVNVPGCDTKYLSGADIPISKHISMRQEGLDKHYVSIGHASTETIEQLKQELISSKTFQTLTTEFNKPSQTSVNREKENYIYRFYKYYYLNYKQRLNSIYINQQLEAACQLLQLDLNDFRRKCLELENKQNKSDKLAVLSLIDRKCRNVSKEFHTDTFKARGISVSEATLDKAKQIFVLMYDARDFLKKIVQTPLLINEKWQMENATGLAQDAYKPRYQYELADGYERDESFYSKLAKSGGKVKLRKNWDTTETEITSEHKHSTEDMRDELQESVSSTSLKIYKKEFKIYTGKNTIYEYVPGYEAFYKLLIAGAIPKVDIGSVFDTYDPNMKLNPGQLWLADKYLTEPALIASIDTFYLFVIALKASRQRRPSDVKIGEGVEPTGKDLFFYLYKRFPETISKDTIESLIPIAKKETFFGQAERSTKKKEMDTESLDILQTIMAEPGNLQLIGGEALVRLCEVSKTLKDHVYSSKLLSLRLWDWFLKYALIDPLFKEVEKQLDNFDRLIIEKLLLGDDDIISILSTKALEKYIAFIRNHSHLNPNPPNQYILPSWPITAMETEISTRKQAAADKSLLQDNNVLVQDINVSVLDCIKRELFAGNENITTMLNEQGLVWLAKEPEMQREYYLHIATSLISQGCMETALEYLNCIADELKLDRPSLQSIDDFIEKIQAIMLENQKRAREEKIQFLLAELKRSLEDESYTIAENDQNPIISQLKNLGAVRDVQEISSKKYSELQHKLLVIVKQLRQGDKSEQLINDGQRIKCEYTRISMIFNHGQPYIWDRFVNDGRNFFDAPDQTSIDISYAKRTISRLFSDSIGVTSRNSIFWKNAKETDVPAFGINPRSHDLIAVLQDIYFVYSCLGIEHTFYFDLIGKTKQITDKTADVEKELGIDEIPQYFDAELIRGYLLRYARNELTVFAEGHRENASYVTHRLFDEVDIKPFREIYALYNRIGKEDGIIETLPQVYERILKADEEICRAAYNDERLENARPLRRFIEIQSTIGRQNHTQQINNKSTAIVTANKISTQITSARQAVRSDALVETSSGQHTIISMQTSKDELALREITSSFKKAFDFRLSRYNLMPGVWQTKQGKLYLQIYQSVIDTYQEGLRGIKTTQQQFEVMMQSLATFLDAYPSMFANDIVYNLYRSLIFALKNDPCLSEFFNLKQCHVDKNVKEIAKALSTAIKNKTYKVQIKNTVEPSRESEKQNQNQNKNIRLTSSEKKLAITYPEAKPQPTPDANVAQLEQEQKPGLKIAATDSQDSVGTVDKIDNQVTAISNTNDVLANVSQTAATKMSSDDIALINSSQKKIDEETKQKLLQTLEKYILARTNLKDSAQLHKCMKDDTVRLTWWRRAIFMDYLGEKKLIKAIDLHKRLCTESLTTLQVKELIQVHIKENTRLEKDCDKTYSFNFKSGLARTLNQMLDDISRTIVDKKDIKDVTIPFSEIAENILKSGK